MGCGSGCSPAGCGNKGHCATGGCNKMNTYDWISTLDIGDPTEFTCAEVNFKNGARKDFYYFEPHINIHLGDYVVVESATGFDIGQVGLKGELVRLQMKKKGVSIDNVIYKIIRKAHQRDMEKLMEARAIEHESMVKARVIARSMGLEMKLGDVEYQADMRKATFYYTADGRVDFRELVKVYAKEFKVKIEMRQIGSRQESARIGGLGSCGRELCCSTWLSDFKSVTTAVARYQNIAINQSKLSGQCGRLKCCLNYELDTYLDALKDFPENADMLKTKRGTANLVKTDIFKGLLYYIYTEDNVRGATIPIEKEKVKEIQALNAKGIFPDDLIDYTHQAEKYKEEEEIKFVDVTGQIELPEEIRKKRNRKSGKLAKSETEKVTLESNDKSIQEDSQNGKGRGSRIVNQNQKAKQSDKAKLNGNRDKTNHSSAGGTSDLTQNPDQAVGGSSDNTPMTGKRNKKGRFKKFRNQNKNKPPRSE